MAELIDNPKRSALSGWPMILGWLAMLIFAFHASTHMVGAGDTWVAMACGRHFINHGVDTVEPFSANSHKAGPTEKDIAKWPPLAKWLADKAGLDTVKYWHPTGWVNQNWLTHVIFYWLTHESPFADADTFSFNTLVYWKFVIYILTVICVYYIGRVLGAHPALSAVFACFAMFVGRSFFDIRPAGFSNLLVAAFLLILVLTTYRNILYIWLIVPIAVFWCNVHGGYIYIFIMLVPFVFLNLLTSISKKTFVSIGLKGVYHTIAAGLVAFLAMAIFNPFHLTSLTHTFVISVSKHAKMWRTVNEWHPGFEWTNPVGTGFPFLVLFIISIGLTLLWFFSRLLKPRFLKAPTDELQAQKRLFKALSTIFAYLAAVFISWTVFVSFSFLSLDPASFLFCALFAVILMLSVCKSVHFVYSVIFLTLMALWSADADAGYLGRYIYPFCLLPAYVITHIIASLLSKNIKVKPINIFFVIAATVVSLLAMILLINPFKFELPLGNALDQFLHLKRIWHPPYERNLSLKYENLFTVLYIVNGAAIVLWFAFFYLRKIFHTLPEQIDERQEAEPYQLPKIDLAIIVIAALSIYMAYRSRRFITIAAIAACPLVAVFIDHIARTISAARNFHRKNRLVVSPMSKNIQMFFIFSGIIAVLAFGIVWGRRFKHVYLDPWPTDTKLTSVFIRMTASDAKPFHACKFIRDNNIKGKMFNYWTEGGFIAWGQNPDPNTGRTPLQLFMDGRAQAAYEPRAYEIWAEIMSGGPLVHSARTRKRKLTADDYTKIGAWVAKKLRKHDVWVVLMPSGQANTPFVKGLEYNPDWPVVFLNEKQKLFVDTKTPQGKKLFEGVFSGETIYPDDFSKSLAIAHNMLMFGKGADAKKQGLDFAIRACRQNPSQITILKVISARRFPELLPAVNDFCKNYVDDYLENKALYAKKDGFHRRTLAALRTTEHLREIAKKQKNTEQAEFYAAKKQEFADELSGMLKTKRW